MVFTPMVVFSGVLYQRSAVPSYLTWLHSLSITNYGFQALIGSQAHVLPPMVRDLAVSKRPPLVSVYIVRLVAVFVGLWPEAIVVLWMSRKS